MEDARAVEVLVTEIKPDVIFHLSGLANGATDMKLVSEIFHSQVTSTVNLLSAATAVGCERIVLAGSLEEPRGMDPEPVPVSPYGAAKWAASAYARMFHRVYETPIVIARTFMTYGPGQPEWKVIPSTIRALLRGPAGATPEPRKSPRRLDLRGRCDRGARVLWRRFRHRGHDAGPRIGDHGDDREVVARLVTLTDASIRPEFGAVPERPSEDHRVADVRTTSRISAGNPRSRSTRACGAPSTGTVPNSGCPRPWKGRRSHEGRPVLRRSRDPPRSTRRPSPSPWSRSAIGRSSGTS